MKPKHRQEALLKRLEASGPLMVYELGDYLQVSSATIYRDIEALSRRNKIYLENGRVGLRTIEENLGEKRVGPAYTKHIQGIAERSLQFINKVDSIFLDGSLESCYLAGYIAQQEELAQITVVTNQFQVAIRLFGRVQYLYLVSGELGNKDHILCTHGIKTNRSLKQVFINKAFVSPDGLSEKYGYTTSNLEGWKLYKDLPEFSKQVIVMLPSEKIGRACLHQIREDMPAHTMVLDRDLSEKQWDVVHSFPKLHYVLAGDI